MSIKTIARLNYKDGIIVYANTYASSLIDLRELGSPVGLIIPEGVTGTSIIFAMSPNGDLANVNSVLNQDGSGSNYGVSCTNKGYQPLDPVAFNGIQYLSIVCASQQLVNTAFSLVLAPIYQ